MLRKIRVRISAHRNPLREAVLTGDFGLSIEREGSKGREQSLELVLSPQIRTTYEPDSRYYYSSCTPLCRTMSVPVPT